MRTKDSRGGFIDMLRHLQICRLNPPLQARLRLLLTGCAGGLTFMPAALYLFGTGCRSEMLKPSRYIVLIMDL